VNALQTQRSALENVLRACLSLSPSSNFEIKHLLK